MTSYTQRHCFSILLLIFGLHLSYGQKDQVFLDPQLDQHSERMLLKIGRISKSKPAKLKFGNYTTDNQRGNHLSQEKKPVLFSFEVIDDLENTALVEASSGEESQYNNRNVPDSGEVSIYLSTSIAPEEMWVLLMPDNEDSGVMSLLNVFLTNGTDEITFKNISGEPTGKSEVTAPRGIQAFYRGQPIGALQYYSGGSFSYKKFIWLSDQASDQHQLVLAAVFAAMMEVAGYFEDSRFSE